MRVIFFHLGFLEVISGILCSTHMFYFDGAILNDFWGVKTFFHLPNQDIFNDFTALFCLEAESIALFFTVIQSTKTPYMA